MAYKLLADQVEAANILANGDDVPNYSVPGAGKTVATMEGIRLSGFTSGLVIAPSIALGMWKEELEEYLGCEAQILKSGKASPKRGANFLITTYGLAANMDLRSRVKDRGGDVLVLDEAHYLKTRTSARHSAVFGRNSNGRGGIFESFSQCWQLTGTPIMRHADDLWAQLRATHGEVLRKFGALEYDDFVREFCVVQMKKFHPRAAMQRVVVASKNPKRLHSMLYGVENVGAMRYEVSGDMPPLTYRTVGVKCRLPAGLEFSLKGLSPEEIAVRVNDPDNVMAKLWRELGEAKVPGTLDYLLEEVRGGPILVGYWHTAVGDALEDALVTEGHSVGRVMGKTSPSARDDVRDHFNAGNLDFIVGQMSAMNVSWNLQKCGNRVVIVEDNFSPGLVEQFIKRVWRFGQGKHVQVDFIHGGSELDDVIEKVRKMKQAVNDVVVG